MVSKGCFHCAVYLETNFICHSLGLRCGRIFTFSYSSFAECKLSKLLEQREAVNAQTLPLFHHLQLESRLCHHHRRLSYAPWSSARLNSVSWSMSGKKQSLIVHTSSHEKDVSPLSLLYKVRLETPILSAIDVFLTPLLAISATRFGNITVNVLTSKLQLTAVCIFSIST